MAFSVCATVFCRKEEIERIKREEEEKRNRMQGVEAKRQERKKSKEKAKEAEDEKEKQEQTSAAAAQKEAAERRAQELREEERKKAAKRVRYWYFRLPDFSEVNVGSLERHHHEQLPTVARLSQLAARSFKKSLHIYCQFSHWLWGVFSEGATAVVVFHCDRMRSSEQKQPGKKLSKTDWSRRWGRRRECRGWRKGRRKKLRREGGKKNARGERGRKVQLDKQKKQVGNEVKWTKTMTIHAYCYMFG